MHCLPPSVTCFQCDFRSHSGSLCVHCGLRTLERMKVKVIPPQASGVIQESTHCYSVSRESSRSSRTEVWVRKCWDWITSQKVLLMQRTNEGGQTGEQADPPSRMLVLRAVGTVGSWEYVSIPTPSTPQTNLQGQKV